MKPRIKRCLSAAAAALVMTMSVSTLGVRVSAADEFTYTTPLVMVDPTEDTGHDHSPYFLKALVMDNTANVPTVDFNYTIQPGTAQNASSSSFAVKAGITNTVSGVTYPKISTVSFTSADTKYPTIQTAANIKNNEDSPVSDSTTLTTAALDGKSYARKEVKIDFSNISFTSPGIYRYIVTETDEGTQGISYDTDPTRVLDVYILDNDGTLEFGGCVFHNSDDDSTITYTGTASSPVKVEPDTKSAGYVNTFNAYNITLSKDVSGNQASRAEYFQFVLKLENAGAGSAFDVDITGAVAAKNETTQIITEADGTKTSSFWLQDDQSITIHGLPAGTKYTIIELGDSESSTSVASAVLANEGYITSATVTGDTEDVTNSADTASRTVSDTGLNADTTIAYTNTLNGIIPTGIMLTYTPYIIISVIAVAGIIFLAVRRRKNAE